MCGKKPCSECGTPVRKCQMIDGKCATCASKKVNNGIKRTNSKSKYP